MDNMRITFRKGGAGVPQEVLLVSIGLKNKDEIVKENGTKTLYLKCEEKMTRRKLFLLVRKMVALTKGAKAARLALDFNDWKLVKISDQELGEVIGTQLDFANYEFTKYKTPPKEGFSLIKEAVVMGATSVAEKAILKGHAVAEEVNKTRSLANTPGGDMTPQILAQSAKDAVKGLPVKVTVLDEKEMAKEKMHAILSVGKGSDEESRFIIMEYWGASRPKSGSRQEPRQGLAPVVLVGKGVTFDTGGINLKPTPSLLGMNMDMSGGAAVIHAVALAAKMKLKKNVVGLIPSVENMASGKSYRPGDVIRSRSGKTIEVLNTDAEGRVILADALSYAEKYKPELVIDVATLTGASAVALGERASALFTPDDALAKKIEDAGEKTGEYVWRLPLWEEYEEEIKGNLGDWTNVHNKDSKYGGAIHGAIFLYQFAKNYKWAHLDIAPRMASIPGEYLAPGSVGAPVRLLFELLQEK
jgi:leucyl aminopeptidase